MYYLMGTSHLSPQSAIWSVRTWRRLKRTRLRTSGGEILFPPWILEHISRGIHKFCYRFNSSFSPFEFWVSRTSINKLRVKLACVHIRMSALMYGARCGFYMQCWGGTRSSIFKDGVCCNLVGKQSRLWAITPLEYKRRRSVSAAKGLNKMETYRCILLDGCYNNRNFVVNLHNVTIKATSAKYWLCS